MMGFKIPAQNSLIYTDSDKRIKIFWMDCTVLKEQEKRWVCSGYVELR